MRSTNLSWSAIGLLARVMDFPHEWNFSKAGLIAICPDGETAIDTALSELKEWGYLEIKMLMPNESSTGRMQPLYSFYEYSARDTSIPQYDYELETFMVENAVLNRVKKTDNYTMISSKLLRNKSIKNKYLGFLLKVLSLPDYWHLGDWLCQDGRDGYAEADEIVGFIANEICSPLPYTTLRGQAFPRAVIQSKMLKANIYMVENVLENMAKVDNIKDFRRYFISFLY